MGKIWRNVLAGIGIVILFLVIAYGFVPQVLDGKIVNQSDISGYVGMAHEANEWNSAHPDDRTAWTNSMFGGMPTTMLTGNPEGDWTQALYDAFLTGKRPATYLFISLLGAFLLMLAMDVNVLLAIGGAIAITFCSYNFQIIQVGHNTKMMAIAWMPWVLAAVVYTYRSALGMYSRTLSGRLGWLKASLLGAALFGLFLDFQIKANHIQISYYLAIILCCFAIGLFIYILGLKDRRVLVCRFLAASTILLVLGIAGIGANANKLIPMYEYSHQTMRGGSELSRDGEATEDRDKSKGLDIEYATAWSYGWNELPNLMIPDFNGGASAGVVDPHKSETVKLLRRYGQTNAAQVAENLPTYWGPQPFTAGPMYLGAISVFLFILGLFLCKGFDRWWILAASIIAVFLGVGSHFMPFTEFWYYHMPFYSKFRTVSMALVILQVTVPLLGFIVVDRILKGRYPDKEFRKAILTAYIFTGIVCLVFWLMPSLAGSFTAPSDAGMHPEIASAVAADRKMLLRDDARLSFFLISAVVAVLLWVEYSKKKAGNSDKGALVLGFQDKNKAMAAGAVCLLVFINMFAVGKRYLNADDFITPHKFNNQFAQRPVDKMIIENGDLSSRVLDLTVNVFNDAHPSYWHKNIGGYSPVKLQRYQDLIDKHLTGEISDLARAINAAGTMDKLEASFPKVPILSALNDKYIIIDGNSPAIVNPHAMGNAWFVDKAVKAESPDDEIALVGTVDLSSEAVIGKDFTWAYDQISALGKGSGHEIEASNVSQVQPEAEAMASVDTVYMTQYAPNELHYRYSAARERAVVFSEVYYPHGWKLYLTDANDSDKGREIPIFRTDWILRGAVLPAGDYNLKMRFEPESYKVSSNISRASSATLFLLILLSCAATLVGRGKDAEISAKGMNAGK